MWCIGLLGSVNPSLLTTTNHVQLSLDRVEKRNIVEVSEMGVYTTGMFRYMLNKSAALRKEMPDHLGSDLIAIYQT
jgi:hypothetical protein